MLKTCRPILLALLVTLVAGVPAPVLAQDTVPPDGTSADNNSFADQFFVARRTDPRTKQKSIELLGSGIIWFLLLLSVTSIGLIGTTAMANQRKTILPPALVAQSRRMITEGRYRDLIDVLSHDESYFGRLMHEALKEANHGFSALVRRLEQAADEPAIKIKTEGRDAAKAWHWGDNEDATRHFLDLMQDPANFPREVERQLGQSTDTDESSIN